MGFLVLLCLCHKGWVGFLSFYFVCAAGGGWGFYSSLLFVQQGVGGIFIHFSVCVIYYMFLSVIMLHIMLLINKRAKKIGKKEKYRTHTQKEHMLC